MPEPENLAELSRDELLRVIAAQQRQIVELTARVEALQAEMQRREDERRRQEEWQQQQEIIKRGGDILQGLIHR